MGAAERAAPNGRLRWALGGGVPQRPAAATAALGVAARATQAASAAGLARKDPSSLQRRESRPCPALSELSRPSPPCQPPAQCNAVSAGGCCDIGALRRDETGAGAGAGGDRHSSGRLPSLARSCTHGPSRPALAPSRLRRARPSGGRGGRGGGMGGRDGIYSGWGPCPYGGARRRRLCPLPPRPEVWRRGGGASPGPPRPALGVGGRPMAGAPRTAGDPDGGAGRQGVGGLEGERYL